MSIPLYQHDSTSATFGGGNLGLWHDKFYEHWDGKSPKWTHASNGKLEWIKSVGKYAQDGVHIMKTDMLLTDHIERVLRLMHKLGGGFWVYRTNGRFVTGLGRAHPIENGFAWHHTLGVPYLPGSSLKGLMRSWAGKENGELFGSNRGKGNLVFFDVLPLTMPKISAAVMTPHYGSYYQHLEVPGDWNNPEPIPFLTVDTGQAFLFAVTGSGSNEIVGRMLEDALLWIGAGAKTAVGYGRFERDLNAERQWSQKLDQWIADENKVKEMSRLSPWQREMLADGYDSEKFISAMDSKWLHKLGADDVPLPDRKQIAQRLSQWYAIHRPEFWNKPNPKHRDRVKRIKQFFIDFGDK